MQDIKQWEEKMKQKRMNTPWREFVKEICSWHPLTFYRNNDIISRYPKTDRIKSVKSYHDFSNISESFTKFGLDYLILNGFFNNFKSLVDSIDLPALRIFADCENADYADSVGGAKDVYLCNTCSYGVENSGYNFITRNNCHNIFNSTMVSDFCDNVYMSIGILKSTNIFYSKHIINSSNMRFCENCLGCNNCISCSNLNNQSYYIKNKKYTKEEYEHKKQNILKNKSVFEINYRNLSERGINIRSDKSNGFFLFSCENVENGYYANCVKDANNILFVGNENGLESIYDSLGGIESKDTYGCIFVGVQGDNYYFSFNSPGGSNLYYSWFMKNCSYCLGCIGLKNKSFCILNKQYTKEERFEKVNEIFAKMEQDGELGKFFPGRMNPFYFNDTVAYLIDESFTKEEVEKEGYLRRDEEIKVDVPQGAEIIETKNLDQYEGFDKNGNRNINPDILKKVIKDEKGNYYRIVKMEYDFLMKHGLPLPRLHWLDRIKLGFKFK